MEIPQPKCPESPVPHPCPSPQLISSLHLPQPHPHLISSCHTLMLSPCATPSPISPGSSPLSHFPHARLLHMSPIPSPHPIFPLLCQALACLPILGHTLTPSPLCHALTLRPPCQAFTPSSPYQALPIYPFVWHALAPEQINHLETTGTGRSRCLRSQSVQGTGDFQKSASLTHEVKQTLITTCTQHAHAHTLHRRLGVGVEGGGGVGTQNRLWKGFWDKWTLCLPPP